MSPLRLERATRFWPRLRGLHAYEALPPNTGLWISRCRAVHTFGLPYGIDIVFLDKNHKLLKRVDRLAPNRLAWHWRAASVVELPAGYCAMHPDFINAIQQELAFQVSV